VLTEEVLQKPGGVCPSGTEFAREKHQQMEGKHGPLQANRHRERVWKRNCANHGEVTNYIADYIVSFYNSVRLHSKLGNLPPNAVELKSAINQPIGVCEKT
jgi:transposase InsO family protein